jgi:cell division protein FtsI/penicillin-binding protein 2
MFGLAKSKKSGLAFLTLIPAFLILSFFSLIPSTGAPAHAPEPNVKRTEPELNADLDHGAIVVLDPQTGRLRAVVNSDLAFRNASPPGSTIKPFTALAALRAGILTENTRIRCPGKYKRNDVVDACVHPAKLPAFNAAEAIAYSCNYFFATTGKHLDQEQFANMLGDFGFVVARGQWQPQSALGEGAFLQVTPVQMATAYAALFNGGALLTPNYDGALS